MVWILVTEGTLSSFRTPLIVYLILPRSVLNRPNEYTRTSSLFASSQICDPSSLSCRESLPCATTSLSAVSKLTVLGIQEYQVKLLKALFGGRESLQRQALLLSISFEPRRLDSSPLLTATLSRHSGSGMAS